MIKDIEKLNNGYEICERILRNSFNTHGIKAGETHFSDVWIRDSCFASWGALEIGANDIVQHFICDTLNYMNEKGQCPLRIGQKYFLLKYFGLKGPSGTTFIEDKYVSIPMDSNALIIILCSKFCQKHHDLSFIKKYYKKLKQAILWYDDFKDNHLIVEGPYAGWADSVKKRGKVLYTNALYFQALTSMSTIADMLNIHDDDELFKEKAAVVKKEINTIFWNGEYLDDWVCDKKTQSTFSVEGNILSILFNIVDKQKTISILEYIKVNNLISEFGLPVVYPSYKLRDVYTPFIPVGLKDYHNGLIWFWISCIASVVYHRHGYDDTSLQLLDIMSSKITMHNTVYEVYEKDGRPVNRFFYKSEQGFAWSAGLFVWAYHQIKT